MGIDWGLLLRIAVFVCSVIATFGCGIGAFYVYRYKISANCRAIKGVQKDIHEIKEEKLPYLVPYTKMEAYLERLEKTIITRLDKMDEERNLSRDKQTEQREKRLIEFTTIATNVTLLSDRMEKIEEKVA